MEHVPPNPLHLDRHHVHVWHASLDLQEANIPNLAQNLSDDERNRANRFRFDNDRQHFIVARSVLRMMLGRYLNLKAEELRFCYSPTGKPAIVAEQGGDRLRFNLSHSHGVAIYSVAQEREVGIDIELIRHNLMWQEIASRYFSPRENETLQALPAQMQHQAFFTAWTRKEAFLKATGQGLSLPIDQVEVTLTPDEPAALVQVQWNPQAVHQWLLQDLTCIPGYAATVAVECDRLDTVYVENGAVTPSGNRLC